MKIYPCDHPRRLEAFMEVAKKHYSGYKDYEHLHKALSHAALLYILDETGL